MARVTMSGDKNYQAHCDVHTLREAEAIKKDAKRHAAARRQAESEIKNLEAVTSGTRTPARRAKK